MKDPFLSIIMPFHNSARTLEASARSVLTQSYAEFELLLVDDVSTDESPAIAAGLAAEDPRVHCFTLPEHGGAAGARNEGIRRAKGDYILFLDSDDFYTEGLLPEAAAAAKGGPDVVLWGLQEEYLDAKGEVTRTVEIRPTAQTLADAESVRRQVMGWEERSLYGYLWNKAYRAELIRGKQIPTQSFNEDEMFNIAVFGEVSSVTALDFIGTRYRIGQGGSLSHRQLPDY